MASSHNLIFLHGWGTSPWVWEKQLDYFSKKYSVAAPDLYLLSTMNYELPTVLIGWSYGGMLAMELAAKQPDKFKALVLVGTSAKFSDGMNPVIIKNLARNLNREFEAAVRNCYGTFFSAEEAVFIDDFVNKQIPPDKKQTIRLLDKLAVLDLREVLKNIKIPTLIIHGDKDEICPVEAGRYLSKNIKNSKLEIVKDVGHMPFYTRPHEFNKILEDFLENVK